MPLMVWNDQLSVGIAAMDEEHKQLIRFLNELYDSVLVDASGESTDTLFKRLVTCNSEHFAHEEHLLTESGYPDMLAHKAEHDQISRWGIEAELDYHQGKLSVPPSELLRQFGEMLQEHIQGADRRMGEFLKQKEAEQRH